MISLRYFITCCLVHFAFYISLGQGQRLSTEDKKAEKWFYTAVDSYQAKKNDKAVSEVQKAIELDPEFTEALILQGDIYADARKYELAVVSYQKAVKTNNPFSPNLFFILANLQLNIGLYDDARKNYQRFLEFEPISDQKKQQALKQLKSCDYALHCVANPVPFAPVNLGDSINTDLDEYINAITPDEERLFFTRKNPRNKETVDQSQDYEEEFYFATKVDSGWRNAVNLGSPVNTHGNEGALNISSDGKYLFFAACNRDDGFGSCDIYWAKRNGSGWSDPENLGSIVNSPQWDSQPSFSSDGKTLYFASKRSGGFGSSDIWKSEIQTDGQWSVPMNLGDSINTKAEEMAPFIHPDNRTLYFSSKGHAGLGGYDLFYARKNAMGGWCTPVNMGYPINTHADEISLVVNASGNVAFISSDKLGGRGRQDIYRFSLYKEAQPYLSTYLKGIVYDVETNEKLEARFELIDLATSKSCVQAWSDLLTGEFLLILPAEKNYALNVSRDGYLFYSDNFFLDRENSLAKPFIKNIPLQKIKSGEAVVLKNIFFDTDQSTLKNESLAELEKLLSFLLKNPELKIEIRGHTDNNGTVEHNNDLSRNRAKAVYEYLIQHGIEQVRLSYTGYGFSQPVDVNTTVQGRANNRRTEFKVLSN
jgi:outer membrane protein OmpA-like peptidoglycan-associated protein/tetratricopeptide (TPR) repeat protein